MVSKFFFAKTALILSCIITGNLFWLLFANTLATEKLLTNSPFHIALSFVFPILLFGIYLSSIAFFSILERSKLLWILVAIFSFLTYTVILGIQAQTILGELGVSAAIFLFIFSFHKNHVLVNKRSSIIARSTLSLTGSTLLISIIIALNFYGFYIKALASDNLIFTNRTILTSLSPLLRIYLTDLKITNLDETFNQYLKDQAVGSKTTLEKTRQETLSKLGLQTADDKKPLRTILVQSLTQTIFKPFNGFRKEIPVLISLGLGIITQTLMTVSSLLSYVFTQALYLAFLRLGILRVVKKDIAVDEVESKES